MKKTWKMFAAGVLSVLMFTGGCGEIESLMQLLPGETESAGSAGSYEQPAAEEAEKAVTALTVGDTDISVPEAKVYAFLMQQPLVEAAGEEIMYGVHPDGGKFDDRMAAELKKQITEIALMASAAVQQEITLSDEEKENVQQRADLLLAQYPALADEGVTAEAAQKAYRRSMLAGKYYDEMTADYAPELTAAEQSSCKVREISQIFVAEGDISKLGKYENTEALMKAILKRAKAGDDFTMLSGKWSSPGTQTVVVLNEDGYAYDADAWIDQTFTEQAVKLKAGEISGVVKTPMGLHILKCISTDDPDLQEQARKALLEKKKKEYFSDVYETLAGKAAVSEGEGWNEISALIFKGD